MKFTPEPVFFQQEFLLSRDVTTKELTESMDRVACKIFDEDERERVWLGCESRKAHQSSAAKSGVYFINKQFLGVGYGWPGI